MTSVQTYRIAQRRLAALAVFVATAAGAPAAAAQAPRITKLGDPSVRSDTLYRLAVKAEDYPEENAVFLLDDGVVTVQADGRYRQTYRQVTQILREGAVDGMQEHSFSYEPGHQKLTVNWIKVLKPDGTVISAKPTQMQESDVPAEMGNPVYSNRRVIRASLTGVAVGTVVDFSYTTEELKPYRPGDYYEWWGVSTGLSVRRSRLIVDAPTAMPLSIIERNLTFARTEVVAGARTVRTWATGDLKKIKPEPYAPDSNPAYMSLTIAAKGTWRDIGAWYAGLARDRYTVTPEVDATLRAVVAKATTLDDSIRAVHKWVAQEIRYISLDFGIGGYQPRAVSEIVRTGFGDCKDKATLFVAMLGRFGVTAYPVLLSSRGGVARTLPSKSQFDHAIVAVKGPSGYTFTDLTADLYPYGQLSGSEQGEFGLVVKPDGETEDVTFPEDPAAVNFSRDVAVGTLSADGTLDIRFTSEVGGFRQGPLRKTMYTPLDSTKRARFLRGFAGALVPGSTGDALELFDGKDLGAAPRLAVQLHKANAVTRSGATSIFTLPYGTPEALANQATDLESMPARKFPIDAAKVIGPITSTDELRLTLPAGWQVQLPKSVHVTGPFGAYHCDYGQEGREFRMTRSITGGAGILPREKLGDLVAWMRAIGADDAKFIVIDRPPGT